MKDLCCATGATFVSKEAGLTLEEVQLEHLGRCKRVEVQKNLTTIIGGGGLHTDVEKTIDTLKATIAASDSEAELVAVQERITRLASGVAIIKVGASTEVEMIEKKHRIEDALEAVKAAQQEGIVPGGGTALLRAGKKLDVEVDNPDQQLGVSIVKSALAGPIRQMALNAGLSADLVVDAISKSRKKNMGWDFSKEKLVNLMDAGIIDPVKVTRNALENAASVSAALITTNYAIVEK